jgi:membrane protein
MVVNKLEFLTQQLQHWVHISSLYWQRCQRDQIGMISGYLAYISLLSLVPLVAVAFSVLNAFPMFSSLRQDIEAFVYANVVPSRGDELQTYINGFVENIGQMTTVGVLFLLVVALMLMHNIDKTLNKIWRVQKRPRLMISLSIYWMILTLGPILLGASIAMTSYLSALTHLADNYTPLLSTFFLNIAPYVVSLLAFFILYQLVPNTRVRYRYAFWGALFSSVLFEMLKMAFALYIYHFPTYQAIYGALALVPILFVWVYLCWVVVLLGAELTALLQELHQRQLEIEAETAAEAAKAEALDVSQ